MESKKTTPCCNDAFDLIYQIHFRWMPEFKQWKCCKCGKEYCEKEMFDVERREEEF